MKLFFLLTTWLAFGAIASAQCQNGQCPQPSRVIRTTTTYEYRQPQQTRYVTLQAVPVPVTVYYVERPRYATPIRSGLRGFFGCR